MGPSIAEGSQGCSPNWADFPVAASSRPSIGIISVLSWVIKICCRSHELE